MVALGNQTGYVRLLLRTIQAEATLRSEAQIFRFTQGRLGVNEYYDAFMDRVDAF